MDRNERFDKAERIIQIGFWVNAFLMIIKLSAGYWGHSDAVFADGIESGCDFIAIFMTLFALKMGRKSFDERHPYGHGKAESLSAGIVGLLIIGTGVWILVESAGNIIRNEFSSPGWIAVAAAAVTIVIKEYMYRWSIKEGGHLGSPALVAVAKDHRKDALTSVSTLVGVVGAYLGWGIMDPLAAGVTSLFIMHIGWETLRGAGHDLMDGSAPDELRSAIVSLAEGVENVEHVHEIRTRRSGQFYIVDLKLDMDPHMTVKQSHDVATEVKRVIFEAHQSIGDVMIHINPHDEDHEDLIRL